MKQPSRYRLGIDIGGTFTDFTLIDTEHGTASGIKVPTVPAAPSRAWPPGCACCARSAGSICPKHSTSCTA